MSSATSFTCSMILWVLIRRSCSSLLLGSALGASAAGAWPGGRGGGAYSMLMLLRLLRLLVLRFISPSAAAAASVDVLDCACYDNFLLTISLFYEKVITLLPPVMPLHCGARSGPAERRGRG